MIPERRFRQCAAGYLATAATGAFGEDAATAWFATQRRELRDGDPEAVLAALLALPAGKERDRAWAYLATRRSQIAYRDFRARGWPIGSGCVERAPKGVVQGRLKGPGLRWALTWALTWAQVGAQQRAAHQARTATRRTTRRARPLRTPLVAHGKPTVQHPWRSFRLPGSPRFPHTI